MQVKSALRSITAWLAIVAGLLGIAFAVVDGAGLESAAPILSKHPHQVALFVMSLLLFSSGVERQSQLRDIERGIEVINKTLAQAMTARKLESCDEVYEVGGRMVREATRHIRALVYGRRPKAPEEYAEAIIGVLREKNKDNLPVKYSPVLACQLDTLTPDDVRAIEGRLGNYKKKGVGDLVTLRVMDSSPGTGLDVLIVDHKHASIAFSAEGGLSQVQSGLAFHNNPKLAEELAQWFDQYIVPQSQTWDQVRRRIMPQGG